MSIILNTKTPILVIIAVITVGLFSSALISPASAAARLKGPINCSVNTSNQLVCTFEASGLGNIGSSSATVTGTVQVTTGCINRGSQGQEPSGLQTTGGSFSATGIAPNVDQGRAVFTVTSQAPSVNRSCPDQMTPTVVCATYTINMITVTTQSGTETIFQGTKVTSNCSTGGKGGGRT